MLANGALPVRAGSRGFPPLPLCQSACVAMLNTNAKLDEVHFVVSHWSVVSEKNAAHMPRYGKEIRFNLAEKGCSWLR